MKKVLSAFFAVIFAVCVLSFPAFAEELQAPVVQFKLINHDEIALRWDEVKGVDYYRIYRTDVETGKTVKYDKTVNETETNIKGLSAETDYIFKVAAVSEKDGEVIAEVKSVGTHVTTPKEWYFKYGTIKKTRDHREEKGYYRENYSGTVQEKINIKNIGTIIAYCDGWYYFIANRGAAVVHDAANGKYIGRIKEDGKEKEILYTDFATSSGNNYRYKVYGDYIYLYRQVSSDGFYDDSGCTYVSDYHKISLKTGEVSKICDVFESSFAFDIYDDYVYFIYYQLEYDEEEEGYNNWNGTYFCRAKTDGTGEEEICEFPGNNVDFSKLYIYNNEIYFYKNDYGIKIYKMPLNGGDIQEITISESCRYITDFEIVNEYIYITGYEKYADMHNKEGNNYYRLKTDGTGLTKQKKPFEWKY